MTVEVDLDHEPNHVPKQNLDDDEIIEVVELPLRNLTAELDRLAKEGNLLFDGLYSVAFGLSLAENGIFKS